MINQQIGNYRFLSILGEGGMAVVYLAENVMLGTRLAIKVLKEEFLSNKNIRSRFLDEAKKMVAVKHPNIVQVFDLIDTGETVAIVLEYVEGKTLKEYLSEKGKLNNSDLKKLFPQMLNALIRIHNAGFVHRDIKPSNFMLSNDGTIKLADFGIAKDQNVLGFTETGTQMGTPMYMSPEQIKSTKDVDHRSDIYSLGVVLYEMVTGFYPYDKKTLSMPEIQVCILRDPLPRTNTSWDNQIAKATAKNEAERFQKCGEWMSYYSSNLVHVKSINDEKTVLEVNNILETNLNEDIASKNFDNSNFIWLSDFNNDDFSKHFIPAEDPFELFLLNRSGIPAYCVYEMDFFYQKIKGKLYNSFAIKDLKGIDQIKHISYDEKINYWLEIFSKYNRKIAFEEFEKIKKIDTLIGSFTLRERLENINELFEGSSLNYSDFIKVIDKCENYDSAIKEIAKIAVENNWNYNFSHEPINNLLLKIINRYL